MQEAFAAEKLVKSVIFKLLKAAVPALRLQRDTNDNHINYHQSLPSTIAACRYEGGPSEEIYRESTQEK